VFKTREGLRLKVTRPIMLPKRALTTQKIGMVTQFMTPWPRNCGWSVPPRPEPAPVTGKRPIMKPPGNSDKGILETGAKNSRCAKGTRELLRSNWEHVQLGKGELC